ncbi:MAG: YeeE/YedE family protein [Rhodocyclaceae bacterium]|nr:YeeE/YedE family protein [Rhodocyclaceae bacterium]MCP5232002.1 YeeE/YedE family protein [Zoogloeaceae bacterium]MCB1910839.1 YeeE/YedE family protein [Rhodocyclaceae bacterium]MCP5239564.1 YeeE/YedE family protein [Zoogloeaceae bacterium]MCP5255902.1 YeeE/YedE family protein [Zoogloeaceae bacterium]
MNNVSKACDPRPFWSPLVAGIALGLVLLLTFVLTGHGLGATGFFTRLAAWSGGQVAFDATYNNVYLGPLLDDGKPLSSWITWQVIGVALGALAASWSAGRFRLRVDGTHSFSGPMRSAMALLGGLLAGFGARVAAGCTSGVGLSGTATLGVAGFVFLGAFFAAGLLASRLVKGGPR